MGDRVTLVYKGTYHYRKQQNNKSIQVIGIDTEANTQGRCFLVSTSLGDSYSIKEFPSCLFSRRYRDKNFVAYNLKYDESAFIQVLPERNRLELWKRDKTNFQGFHWSIISTKLLRIRKGKHSIHIWDAFNFYNTSLNRASKLVLGKEKKEVNINLFTPEYIKRHKCKIENYCVHDAKLTKELMTELIKRFESYGIYPTRLYSTAYISQQYFLKHCDYYDLSYFLYYYPEAVEYAMQAYSGGKFEVTEKGSDYYYLYDIKSAYPYEISQLKSLQKVKVVKSKHYRKDADYSYFKVKVKIPFEVFNTHPHKVKNVNIFYMGDQTIYVTKKELEYFLRYNVDFTILKAYHLFCGNKKRIFEKEVKRLYALKQQFRASGDYINERIVKILLNSLYGKFWQMIAKKGKIYAGILFNPFYASEITANCRIRMTELQQQYECVKAVHTDSVISTEKIPLDCSEGIGKFSLDYEGEGIILGTGVYTIKDKNKLRGFSSDLDLFDICKSCKNKVKLIKHRPRTWREVTFHGWNAERINLFEDDEKYLHVDFDTKRIWLNDYKKFKEVFDRKVQSAPYMYSDLFAGS